MVDRYKFDLKNKYVRKNIFKPWFWKMWGIKQTLKFIVLDTLTGDIPHR